MDIQLIDKKRKEKRYTVTELCKCAGIDRTTYYKNLKNPATMKIVTLEKLMNVLELTKEEKKQILG